MNFNQNEKQLLNYLYNLNDNWISSKQLSSLLNVSTRQIRNYIKQINEFSDNKIIESSNLGYKLNLSYYKKLNLEKLTQNNFNNIADRQSSLIQMLIKSSCPIQLEELYNYFFISESTLERDLLEIEKQLQPFNITILREQKNISLLGNEKQKRSFMRFTLKKINFEEFSLLTNSSILNSSYDLRSIVSNLKRIFHDNNQYANDYVIENMVIHLIIIIDRLREGYEITQNDLLDTLDTSPKLLDDIIFYLETTFEISFNTTEQTNLLILISNNTTSINFTEVNVVNLHTYIDQKYIDLAKNLMDKVTKEYYLDPFSDEFIVQFTLHISNLLRRLSNNYLIKNPLTIKIKENYPLIYDIAVSMAQEIKKTVGEVINEDEITFLAFHIGGYFEKNKNKDKLKTYLVLPEYYSMNKIMSETIQEKFSNELNILQTLSQSDYQSYFSNNQDEIDLIISSIPLTDCNNQNFVLVNPWLSDDYIKHIQELIIGLRKKKKKTLFKENFSILFNESSFFPSENFTSKEEIISKMVGHAVDNKLVNPSFEDDILERENMSETVYNGIAVPHSMTSKNVIHNFISISTSKQGNFWGDTKIYLVILIGITQKDRKKFGVIFEQLIELLLDKTNIKSLTLIDNYQQFINKFYILIDEE